FIAVRLKTGIVSAQSSTLDQPADVRFGSKADISLSLNNVRFTPIADIGTQQRDVCFVPIADIGGLGDPAIARATRARAASRLAPQFKRRFAPSPSHCASVFARVSCRSSA